MKSFILVCLVILSTSINYSFSSDAAQETVSKHGQLSVKGTQLVDRSGQPVQLKGMSLFWSVWMEYYWNAEAVSAIKNNCHSNIVRAAMAVEYEGYLTDPAKQMKLMETIIEAAIKDAIYVIADWHDWNGEKHLQQAKGFFDQISKKYGHYPNLIYETYNEPIDIDWSSVVKPYHEEIIKVIRANDPDNVILLGSPHYDQDLDKVLANPLTGQTNIMYTLHFYSVDTKQWLRDRIQNVINNGIPVFVSEYGTCAGTGNGTVEAAETQLWWQWLDQNRMSYVNWAFSDKDESASVNQPGTPVGQGCLEPYLTQSGRLVVAQNKK
nr:glycoside hydrolase family 5 subfamily 2 [Agapanthia villosoviridescens]